jgi:uncharacterized protein (DUF2147 family)
MRKLCGLLSLVFLMALAAHGAAQEPDRIVGTWMNGKKTAHIRIEKIDGKYFGTIVHLTEPVYPAGDEMAGKAKVDRENPDPSKRSAPIIGLRILRDFVFRKDNLWEGGRIYDPENGKDYKCKMTLKPPDVLEVRGFVGISLIGRTDTWRRVE